MKQVFFLAGGLLASATAWADAPLIDNGSFEVNALNSTSGAYAYGDTSLTGAPTLPNLAPSWTFVGNSGVSSNGSAWFGTATEGSFFAFIQNAAGTTSISQSFNTSALGSYSLIFDLALRPNYSAGQQVTVSLDGSLLGTYTPLSSTAWSTIVVNQFGLAAGFHTLTFAGTNPVGGGDTSAFIDNVSLNRTVAAVPEPAGHALLAAGFGLLGFVVRRRKG